MSKFSRECTRHFRPILVDENVVPQLPNGLQPIFKLPIELLCNILLKTLDDGDQLDFRHPTPGVLVSKYCSFNPTVLTRVCSLWRHVALSFPALWSRIHLHKLKKTQIRPLSVWLERSKDCPLEISIDDNRDEILIDMASACKILSMIFSCSSRWRKIFFKLGLWSVMPMSILVRSSDPCHWLTVVDYCIGWIITQPTPAHLVEPICDVAAFLHASPILKRIHWFHGVSNILNSKSSFTNLEWVSLEFPVSGANLLQLVAELPNIRYLLICHWVIPCSRISSPVIVLEKLEELHICSFCPLDPFLEHVALPSLKILDIHCRGSATPYGANVFRDLLQRSDCRLEELRIFGKGPEARLEEFFTCSQLKHLKTLDLTWDNISDDVIRLLAFSGGRLIMPNLQYLRLGLCNTTEDGILSRIVLGRWFMPLKHYSMQPAGRLCRAIISCTKCGSTDKTFFNQNYSDCIVLIER